MAMFTVTRPNGLVSYTLHSLMLNWKEHRVVIDVLITREKDKTESKTITYEGDEADLVLDSFSGGNFSSIPLAESALMKGVYDGKLT